MRLFPHLRIFFVFTVPFALLVPLTSSAFIAEAQARRPKARPSRQVGNTALIRILQGQILPPSRNQNGADTQRVNCTSLQLPAGTTGDRIDEVIHQIKLKVQDIESYEADIEVMWCSQNGNSWSSPGIIRFKKKDGDNMFLARFTGRRSSWPSVLMIGDKINVLFANATQSVEKDYDEQKGRYNLDGDAYDAYLDNPGNKFIRKERVSNQQTSLIYLPLMQLNGVQSVYAWISDSTHLPVKAILVYRDLTVTIVNRNPSPNAIDKEIPDDKFVLP